MKAGRESRNFSKSFEPRRKATRGACYRWHYVVDNASVFVFMYIGQRRHVRSPSSVIWPQAATVVLWTPPVLLASPLALVLLVWYHNRHPHPYRLATSPSLNGPGVCVWFRGGCGFRLSLLLVHASPSSTACLLPPSLLSSCPLVRQRHTPAQPPFLWSSVPFVRTSICRSGFGSE